MVVWTLFDRNGNYLDTKFDPTKTDEDEQVGVLKRAQKRENFMEMVLVTQKYQFYAKTWPVSSIEILPFFASKVLYDCQFDQRSGK